MYVPERSPTPLPETKERMGSLCADVLEENVLPSWILCGWARGGLKAPAVGAEPWFSRELTDEFLLKAEKPKLLGEAMVVVEYGAIAAVNYTRSRSIYWA